MKREIKFRAWDKLENRMLYKFFVFESQAKIQKSGATKGVFVDINKFFSEKQTPIMQFTGLTDKNGVEIYEGDILEWKTHNPETTESADVRWMISGWALGNSFFGMWPKNEVSEIIGNIYQDNKLINQKPCQ
ncbi:MAG: YopX family protein [Minisyncoccia bacterium]